MTTPGGSPDPMDEVSPVAPPGSISFTDGDQTYEIDPATVHTLAELETAVDSWEPPPGV